MKKDPTPTLPLPGEGARTPHCPLYPSPWQGGGWEGVNSQQGGGWEGVNSQQEGVCEGVNSQQGGVCEGGNSQQGGGWEGVNSQQGGVCEGVNSQQEGGREGVNSQQREGREEANSYTQPASLHNRPQYKQRRQELRSQPTPAEHHLWQYLRKNQLGVKFRRQHGIHHYIVDFYCPEHALAIEVDGEVHTSEYAREYDQERDNLLKSCGLQVLRFTNHQVLHDTPTTLTQIQQALSLPPPPRKGEVGRGSSSD